MHLGERPRHPPRRWRQAGWLCLHCSLSHASPEIRQQRTSLLSSSYILNPAPPHRWSGTRPLSPGPGQCPPDWSPPHPPRLLVTAPYSSLSFWNVTLFSGLAKVVFVMPCEFSVVAETNRHAPSSLNRRRLTTPRGAPEPAKRVAGPTSRRPRAEGLSGTTRCVAFSSSWGRRVPRPVASSHRPPPRPAVAGHVVFTLHRWR